MIKRLLSLVLVFWIWTTVYAQFPTPEPNSLDMDAVQAVQLDEYAVLPTLTETAYTIYQRGERDKTMFAKVGDSMTASDEFLAPLVMADYDLGEYADLQAALDHFDSDAFARESAAATEGFMTISVLDPLWAGEDCQPNESPLLCEYRQTDAAFALIMFGTNDVMAVDAATFDYYLRTVVTQTAEAGVVPVLFTFPPRPEAVEKSLTFNRIIVTIAEDYDLPLVNLLTALEPLPNYGVDPDDTLHLTTPAPPATTATFNAEAMEAGYTVRNLVTLQALYALLQDNRLNS